MTENLKSALVAAIGIAVGAITIMGTTSHVSSLAIGMAKDLGKNQNTYEEGIKRSVELAEDAKEASKRIALLKIDLEAESSKLEKEKENLNILTNNITTILNKISNFSQDDANETIDVLKRLSSELNESSAASQLLLMQEEIHKIDNLTSIKKDRAPIQEISLGEIGRGSWASWKMCKNNTYICGLRQKIQPHKGGAGDDAGVTGLKLRCCPL